MVLLLDSFLRYYVIHYIRLIATLLGMRFYHYDFVAAC